MKNKKGMSSWAGVLIVVGIIILLIFVINPDVSETLKGNSLESSENGGSLIQKVFDEIECPEGIIPDNITFYKNQMISGIDEEKMKTTGLFLLDPVWKDGTPFGMPSGLTYLGFETDYYCHRGSGAGENINYFYCNDLTYSKEIKDIDPKGNILRIENKKYKIDLIIDLSNPLGERILTRTNSFGLTLNMGKLTYHKIVEHKCKII